MFSWMNQCFLFLCSPVLLVLNSSAGQRKSNSGLRLWRSWCTERAAANSGSRSAHWDSSWIHQQKSQTRKSEDSEWEVCTQDKGKSRGSCGLFTCLSWLEVSAVEDICEIKFRRNCLVCLMIWEDSSCQHRLIPQSYSVCFVFIVFIGRYEAEHIFTCFSESSVVGVGVCPSKKSCSTEM